MAKFSATSGRIFIDNDAGAKVFDTDIPMPARIGQQSFQQDVEFPDFVAGSSPPTGVQSDLPSDERWRDVWSIPAACDSSWDSIEQRVQRETFSQQLNQWIAAAGTFTMLRDYTLGPITSGLDIWWTQVKIQTLKRSFWWRATTTACSGNEKNQHFALFPEDNWIGIANSMLVEVAGSIQNAAGSSSDPPWLIRSLSVFPSGGDWLLRIRHTNNRYLNDVARVPAFQSWDEPTVNTQLRVDVRITEGRWLST
jgi:hypothetical protein